ncbi:MAG: alpha/beta hydrolase [Bacteroidetes bacterium]|nr:alpha/beta hydrolase [Bacteroidota bacterium]
MKQLFIFLLFIPFRMIAQDTLLVQEQAQMVLENCMKGKFSEATAFFDKDFAYRFNADNLAQTWSRVTTQLGQPVAEQKQLIYLEKVDSLLHVYQTIQFEKKELDLKMVFNSTNKIIGWNFTPPSGKFSYKAPSWVKPGQVREQDIQIPTADLRLPGKLTLPSVGTNFPLIILVQGSGPFDMDYTFGPNRVFKDLALSLASLGFAVIRYDKRSLAYMSELMNVLPYLSPYEETVQDVLAAITFGAANEFVDSKNIFVLGHSFGGLMAPEIALKSKQVKGLILLAANAYSIQDGILQQMKYLSKADSTLNKSVIDMEPKVRRVTSKNYADSTDLTLLPMGKGAPYWRYLNDYDQFKAAKDCKVPILLLQGERDYQVTMDEFKIWQTKLTDRPNVTFKSFPQLNHLFMQGTGPSLPSEYEKRSNVSLEVIEEINNWLLRVVD